MQQEHLATATRRGVVVAAALHVQERLLLSIVPAGECVSKWAELHVF